MYSVTDRNHFTSHYLHSFKTITAIPTLCYTTALFFRTFYKTPRCVEPERNTSTIFHINGILFWDIYDGRIYINMPYMKSQVSPCDPHSAHTSQTTFHWHASLSKYGFHFANIGHTSIRIYGECMCIYDAHKSLAAPCDQERSTHISHHF